MENDIIKEFFQEMENFVVSPILTMQEIPYKNMERIFARFGLYEKFKELIESDFDEVEYLKDKLDDLTDELEDEKGKIIDIEDSIKDAIEELKKVQDNNKVIQKIIENLERAIF